MELAFIFLVLDFCVFMMMRNTWVFDLKGAHIDKTGTSIKKDLGTCYNILKSSIGQDDELYHRLLAEIRLIDFDQEHDRRYKLQWDQMKMVFTFWVWDVDKMVNPDIHDENSQRIQNFMAQNTTLN